MSEEIRFGTDGWRAQIGFGFTEDSLRRLMSAVGRRMNDISSRRARVVVGHDTRFQAREFARIATEALLAEKCHVTLSRGVSPTPALCIATRELDGDVGVMLTASHNPYSYLGVKLRASNGNPMGQTLVEEIVAEIPTEYPSSDTTRLLPHETDDFIAHYQDALEKWIDLESLKESPLRVLIDYMHGAQIGVPQKMGLGEGRLAITGIRDFEEPGFGGGSPEPIPRNLEGLSEGVLRAGKTVGLAFDGDGDRLAVCDERGDLLWPQEVFGIIADEVLLNPPEGVEKGGIAKSLPTSDWLARVAEAHDVPLIETPVGFKHLSQFLLSGESIVAGEESGGIGMGFHLPERDGLLGALFLLRMLARERKPLFALRKTFRKKYGDFFYERRDQKVEPEVAQRLRADTPAFAKALTKALGVKEDAANTLDGVKVRVKGGWVMVRASGTEPLLRIYSESEGGAKAVDALIATAAQAAESLKG